MRCLDTRTIFLLAVLPALLSVQAGPVSGSGGCWVLSSLDSPRAFLHTNNAMTWLEAEDFCQLLYGHLATDDSEEYLREYLKLTNTSGDVWIGLHQSKPNTQFTWT